jgi:hypothetical protein
MYPMLPSHIRSYPECFSQTKLRISALILFGISCVKSEQEARYQMLASKTWLDTRTRAGNESFFPIQLLRWDLACIMATSSFSF